MKTENLSLALEHHRQLIGMLDGKESNDYKVLLAAQQELSEVTKLVDVVKGFIEDNDIMVSEDANEMPDVRPVTTALFIEHLCNIVSYKD